MPPYSALGFHLCRSTCNLTDANRIYKQRDENEKAQDYMMSLPIESDCGTSLANYYNLGFNAEDMDHFGQYKDGNWHDWDVSGFGVQVPHLKYDSANFDESSDLYLFGAKDDQVNKSQIYKTHLHHFTNRICQKCFDHKTSGPQTPFEWCPKHITDEPHIDFVIPNVFNVEITNKDKLIDKSFSTLTKLFKNMKNVVGVMLDMNTPVDYNINSSCISDYDQPWASPDVFPIYRNTPCLDATFGKNNQTLIHYQYHNIYGQHHMKTYRDYIKQQKDQISFKRPFLLSLSTFTGSGQYGGHWGGHYPSNWSHLPQTIFQVLENSINGIPLSGAPVCGFTGEPEDEELCLRWYQLAAFQPLMFSHRDIGEILVDPISLNNPQVLLAIKNVLSIRYSLLPYWYTLFYQAHTKGNLVVKPLFAQFPQDKNTFKIDTQFMIGNALMVSPALSYGTKVLDAYFPAGYWYDFYNGKSNIKYAYVLNECILNFFFII